MTVPNSVDSERALLGAILVNASILDKISLSPEDFFMFENETIYSAMVSIGGAALDLVSLSELLERQGKMEEVGGIGYLSSLVRDCPNAFNYETYAKIIRDTSSRRAVIEYAQRLANAAFNEESNIGDEISMVISSLVSSVKSDGGAEHISSYLRELYEEAEQRAENPKEIYGLETGFYDFDKITHGLQKGEQFVLAGAPGTGKSLLAFQLGCGMAEHGYPGAVYELEMTGVAVTRRRISAISKISTYNIRSGKEMNSKWEDFVKAIEIMEKLPVYISQESNWTTMQMRADLARLKERHDIRWFVVDYMGLLSDRYNGDDLERQAFISHQLRAIAKDLGLAGLTLQSVNKAGYSNPSMANVSGPTAIHHDADQIAILTKDEDVPNLVELRWEKMREADHSGIMKLVKLAGFPAFECYKKIEPVSGSNNYWDK